MRYPTEQVEKIRNDVVMGALRGLSVRLGSLREGRKSVIFVSEGFTAMLPPQMRKADASQPDNPIQSRACRRAAGQSAAETAEWFGQTDVYSRMREVTDRRTATTRRSTRSIPRGLARIRFGLDDFQRPPPSFATDAACFSMTQDTLRSMSDETDGRAIVNRNTL